MATFKILCFTFGIHELPWLWCGFNELCDRCLCGDLAQICLETDEAEIDLAFHYGVIVLFGKRHVY